MIGAYDAAELTATLRTESARPIASHAKGVGALAPATPADVATTQMPVSSSGCTLPLLVVYEQALQHNIDTMAAWCDAHGALLAPHAKTTMSPQIVARQLRAGAWATTVASVDQLRALLPYGARRFLIANQVVDPAALQWLYAERRRRSDLDVGCWIDSVETVAILAAAAEPDDVPLDVLIELGRAGGRAGVRAPADVPPLVTAAQQAGLRVCGVAAFEGILAADRSPEAVATIGAFVDELLAVAAMIPPTGVTDTDAIAAGGIVTAGGSVYFDVVADRFAAASVSGARLVLRSGGYVTQDHGYLEQLSPLADKLRPSFEVWAHVLSRPEPGLAVVAAGKRDLPFDIAVPTVLGAWRSAPLDLTGVRVDHLNDQHAYLVLPDETDLVPGDVVRLGGAHPCTAFDKWAYMPLLDDENRIVDVIRTLF